MTGRFATLLCLGTLPQFLISFAMGQVPTVPLYRVFETAITNTAAYANKFADVELNVVFTSPTGQVINFWGLYRDGVCK